MCQHVWGFNFDCAIQDAILKHFIYINHIVFHRHVVVQTRLQRTWWNNQDEFNICQTWLVYNVSNASKLKTSGDTRCSRIDEAHIHTGSQLMISINTQTHVHVRMQLCVMACLTNTTKEQHHDNGGTSLTSIFVSIALNGSDNIGTRKPISVPPSLRRPHGGTSMLYITINNTTHVV